MDKAELVGITLDRLIDHFKLSPESFEFTDNGTPTITWQPKIQLGDLASNPIYDPNNAHAVVVQWNQFAGHLTCYVFLTAPTEPRSNVHKADSTMVACRWFERYRSNHRKMIKLKSLILARDAQKANLIYLRKLSSIFPDAMDGHIR